MTPTVRKEILKRFAPLLGEIAQHEINVDPDIVSTSDWYFKIYEGLLNRHPDIYKRDNPRLLEIACYRHVLAYKLARCFGFTPTLFDISDYDLEAGRSLAEEAGLSTEGTLVAGDFHNLPFGNAYFDFAYVSAALHHTKSPERVIGEIMRTICNGGYFYCQREPVSRLFCFFKFSGNKPALRTALERQLAERGLTRIVCSPFHGARNAIVFGRIENDRIALDDWVSMFSRHGEIVERMLHHDGMLSHFDREILAHDHLSQDGLADFIAARLVEELKQAAAFMTRQDELLGHSLPTSQEIPDLALRVAFALKSRHPDTGSAQWQEDMVRIFGASARFLVRRKNADGRRDKHLSRYLERRGSVLLDGEPMGGLSFWDRLLPDLTTGCTEEFSNILPPDQWTRESNALGHTVFVARRERGEIRLPVNRPAVLVVRYRVALDEKLPIARVKTYYGSSKIIDDFLPQSEDRIVKVVCDVPNSPISIRLCDEHGKDIIAPRRIWLSVVQAVPIELAPAMSTHAVLSD